jgi:hypothetical protein
MFLKVLKAELSLKDKQFTNEIETHLKGSLISLLTFKLQAFKKDRKLDTLIKYDNFRLFDWSLENRNIPLINYLLDNLSLERCFDMLKYDNYAAIKKFISVSKSSWEKVSDQVDPILKAILEIEPEQETLVVIQNELLTQLAQANNETIKYLQNYIKSQIKSTAYTEPANSENITRYRC